MSLTAWVNGNFVPLEDARIHIEDRGFQFADGVYEVIACIGGTFLELEPHLERLEHSCHEIHIQPPMLLKELAALVRELYAKNPFSDAMIYIQVTRGQAPRTHLIDTSLTPSLILTARELPKPSAEKLETGTTGITLSDIRWRRCDIKSTALLGSVLGRFEAQRQQVDEAYWLDDEGHVLEGCATNIFAVIDGKLVTHPLDHRVLGGITRNMAIRLALGAGIPVEERPWKLSEAGLSECMMSSTTNAVLPVTQINHQPVADGIPGPVSRKIRELILAEFDALRQQ